MSTLNILSYVKKWQKYQSLGVKNVLSTALGINPKQLVHLTRLVGVLSMEVLLNGKYSEGKY